MESCTATDHRPEENLPSTGTDYWVYSIHPEFESRYVQKEHIETIDSVEDGKWMLFYPQSDMDVQMDKGV